MDKFGLIGYPIAHSLSPVLFNQAYGGKWVYDLIEEPSFDEAWRRFTGSYKAVNVTAPYKEDAFRKADTVPQYVQKIGACNILVKTPEGIAAHNSDYLGVKALLEESFGPARPANRTALIIGFGGAGKAAAAAARDAGMDVAVCNRTTSKARSIRPLEDIPMLAAASDIVIYTLPCPVPQTEGMSCRCLLEANYRTPALESHPGIGRYIHGREWIIRQARTGYALMTGEEPGEISLNN